MDASQYSDFCAALSAVPDPRQRRGRRYAWPVLLTLIAAALVSGQQGMRAIGQWVSAHGEELGPGLGLPPGRVPSAATLRRAVQAVDLVALEEVDGKDVLLGGGVATIRQYLRAGLVDEMHFAIPPVLLGSGEHLFADIDTVRLGYRCAEHVPTENATHVVLTR